MTPTMIVFWNADGDVIGTVSHMVVKDDAGNAALVDFAAHEHAGGRMRDIEERSAAAGAGTWPEWVIVHGDWSVELHDSPAPARAKIAALVHKKSGHRRERAAIEAEIERRTQATHAEHRKHNGADIDVSQVPVDLRDLLGGPDRPLILDEDGKTKPREKSQRPNLPVIAATNRR